jgi:hypothetical protein
LSWLESDWWDEYMAAIADKATGTAILEILEPN